MERLEIGPSPCDESCAQIGIDPDFQARNLAECRAFKNQIERVYGPPPDLAQLKIFTERGHDAGPYREVAVFFQEGGFLSDEQVKKTEAAMEYAYKVEADELGGLRHWDAQARQELGLPPGEDEAETDVRAPASISEPGPFRQPSMN